MIFVLFSSLILMSVLYERRILGNIVLLITALYFSFTYAYGYDWINYFMTYVDIGKGYGTSAFFSEPVMFQIMKAFNYVGFDFSIYNMVVTFVIYYSTYVFCKKRQLPCLAFFTIFSFMGFYVFTEGVRQGLAMAILFFAIDFYIKGNRKKFYIIVAMACFVHVSSVFALLYPFVFSTNAANFKKRMIFTSVLFAAFIYLILNPTTVSFVPVIGARFYAYSTIIQPDVGFVSYLLSSRVLVLYLAIWFWIWVISRKTSKGEDIHPVYIAMLIFCFSRISPSIIRVGFFMVPIVVIYMDYVLRNSGVGIKTKLHKLIYIALLYLISFGYPVFNKIYFDSSSTNLSVFSTRPEVYKDIKVKCDLINAATDEPVIQYCLMNGYGI